MVALGGVNSHGHRRLWWSPSAVLGHQMPLEGAGGLVVGAWIWRRPYKVAPKTRYEWGYGAPINGLISRVTTPTYRGEITHCYPFIYFSGHL